MNKLPDLELVLVPGGTLITETPEEGRQEYAKDSDSLTAASHVVATEFQTIAAANNYWPKD